MPDKANCFGFAKCNACASTSDGPGLGPLSTVSHPQVCCLFKVARQEQFSDPFLNEGSHKQYDSLCEEQFSDPFLMNEGSCKWYDGLYGEQISDLFLNEGSRKRHDGLCEDCPNGEFHVGPVYGQPPTSEASSPEGCEAAPEVNGSPSRKRKPIEPRKREGYKKFTLEWRPPKFQRKIWFGTYSNDEINRAKDAVNYYLRREEPYLLPDSRRIFEARPLTGIKFQDLLPSCDQVVEEALVKSNLMGIAAQDFLPPRHQAAKTLPAYVVYGRQVKNVVHSVLGKRKKSAEKKNKGNVQASQKLDTRDDIVPHPLSPENEEDLAPLVRFIAETSNYPLDDEPFPLDEMFSPFPMLLNPNYGESSVTEEGSYSADLWELSSYG